MTFQPVLPPLLLAVVAAIILVARIATLRRLASAARTRSARWRWSGVTLAALLLVAAATRPVLDPAEQASTRVAAPEVSNVFVIIDRSADMQVQDQPNGSSRMAVARDDVAAVLDRYPHARVAVISFASRAALDWPLSADTWSLRPVASALTPYAAAADGGTETNAGAAGNMLRYQLIGAMQQYPRAKNLVVYLGAGAPEAALPPRDFNLPEGAVDGGVVLGYGTTAVGESALRAIAGQIGGISGLASVLPADVTDSASGPIRTGEVPDRTELYWAPAALAAALVLVELYYVLREFRRTRMSNADVVL
jgi:hypothetical protein